MGSAGLMGLGIAPILAISAPGYVEDSIYTSAPFASWHHYRRALTHSVIFSAALGTAAIFGGFTLAALKAKRRSMLMLGVLHHEE